MEQDDEAAADAHNDADYANRRDLVTRASNQFGLFAKAVMQYGRQSLPYNLKPKAYDLLWLMWKNNGSISRPTAMKHLQFENGSSFSHFLSSLQAAGSRHEVNWISVEKGTGSHGADTLHFGDDDAQEKVGNLVATGFGSYAAPFGHLSAEDLQNLLDILGKLNSALNRLKSPPEAADVGEPEQPTGPEAGIVVSEAELCECSSSGITPDVAITYDNGQHTEVAYCDEIPNVFYDEPTPTPEHAEQEAEGRQLDNGRSRYSAWEDPHGIKKPVDNPQPKHTKASDVDFSLIPDFLRDDDDI